MGFELPKSRTVLAQTNPCLTLTCVSILRHLYLQSDLVEDVSAHYRQVGLDTFKGPFQCKLIFSSRYFIIKILLFFFQICYNWRCISTLSETKISSFKISSVKYIFHALVSLDWGIRKFLKPDNSVFPKFHG